MPIINSQTPEFSVQAYHSDEFVPVTTANTKGHWSVFFFYLQISPLSAPPNWATWPTPMLSCNPSALKCTRLAPTPTLCTKPGTMRQRPSKRSPIR